MSDERANAHAMVDAYFHGLLSEEDRRHVQSMVESDKTWRLAFNHARQRYETLRGVPMAQASSELIESTLKGVRTRRDVEARLRRRRTWVVLGPLAATVVILCGLQLYYHNLQANPYDVRVLGQTTLAASTTASMRVLVTRYESGDPTPNVPVELRLRDDTNDRVINLARFTTDASGTGSPRFELPDWDTGDYELEITARTPRGRQRLTRTVRLTRSWSLMVSTDKPVYQPGQTIRTRALALRRPDLHPVAGRPVVFTISDPRGNVIFKQHTVTSEFGIASSDCTLADQILHGPYTLRCNVDDTESATTVEVRDYVLPKFKVLLELDRPYYAPDEMLIGSVSARYFFGEALGGAAVEIEFLLAAPIEPVIPLQRFALDTTGRGRFAVKLPSHLIGREQDGDARLVVRAKVMDTAHQAETRQTTVLVTTRPLRVEAIPGNGRLVGGLPNRLYLVTTYADGRPAITRLAITGFDQELSTNTLGVATATITPSRDNMALTVRAVDDAGLVAQRTFQLDSQSTGDDYILRTDKAVYRGGETMIIEVLGRGSAPIFLDVLKDGQTMLAVSVPMKNGRGRYELDMPAELSGTLRVVTYRFGSAGLPVRKSRTVYIKQARSIDVVADVDQQSYRPGTTANLRLRLRQSDGQPVRGAISLAAVDEAVFAVLPGRPGTEQAFFTLEQELLQPIYAIYDWHPAMFPAAAPKDRRELDAALFAATVTDGASDRPALLQRLVDEGFLAPENLEVLESPDAERILQRMGACSRSASWLFSRGRATPCTRYRPVPIQPMLSVPRPRGEQRSSGSRSPGPSLA